MLIKDYFKKISLPDPGSHKGQNGKLLVIGGSELFHASIFWSAQIASKFVDIVHFTSPMNENNQLVRQQLKAGFWQGIVVDWHQVEAYIQEDDVVLIGPGMERNQLTANIINHFLEKYPKKKWVIDGGALQEVAIDRLGQGQIITPHKGELKILLNKIAQTHIEASTNAPSNITAQQKTILSPLLRRGLTILAKGPTDTVLTGDDSVAITGGNAGLTKGGSGDILAGLVAAFYTQTSAVTACVLASLIVKKSAEKLWQEVGPNFNAADLIRQIPKTFWQLMREK